MRREIVNPKIVLLDCALEYKKGESQTSVEMMTETDLTRMLELEEEYVQKVGTFFTFLNNLVNND